MYSVLSRNEPLPLTHHNFLPRGAGRVSLVWRGGHVIRPLFGDWFGPEWPKVVVKFYCPWRIQKPARPAPSNERIGNRANKQVYML